MSVRVMSIPVDGIIVVLSVRSGSRSCRNLRDRGHRRMILIVPLHLHLKTQLVFSGHVLVFPLVDRIEGPPTLSQNATHLYELDAREFLHDHRAHFIREKHIGATSTLWSSWILGTTLAALARAMIFHHNTTSVMAWRRDIIANLVVELNNCESNSQVIQM